MRWGIIAALVLWCGFCAAEEVDLETVRETLDKAMDSCFKEIIELDEDITERIDRLIKMAGIRGDLDTVEELQRQRETYLITGFLPDSPVHLLIRRKAQLVINRVQTRLDQAYEQAVETLTKEGRYADARRIKNERLNLYKKLSADQVELQRTNIIKQARERRELLQQQPEEQGVSSDTKMTVVSGQTKIELVEVNDLGNPPDKTGYGSVNYKYLIGRYEITIEQYCVFLNAVASEKDPHRLFDESRMTDDPNTMSIKRSGQPGNYAYEPMRFAKYATNLVPGCVLSSRRPMSQVSWMDAARFCNWLHNGQGDGDTETGAYMIGQGNSRPVRQPNARYFLPTENEWYKAAYYHQLDNGQFAYTKYATSTNIEPTKWIDTYNPHYSEEVGQWVPRYSRTNDLPNIANWGRHGGHFDTLAPVDHFPMSRSNYGCQGMTGNVDEYVEDGFESPRICRRGGNWWNSPNNHPDSLYRREAGLYDKGATEGFRIAGLPQN